MANTSISSFVVRAEDGSVNVEASEAKFNAALQEYIEQRASNGNIPSAIDSVLSGIVQKFGDTRVNKQRLCNVVATLLCGELSLEDTEQMENHSRMTAMVSEYIKDHTTTTRQAGCFSTQKGPSGGVKRWEDVTAEEEKHLMQKQRELAAKKSSQS